MNKIELMGDTSVSVPIDTIWIGAGGLILRPTIWHYFEDDPNAVTVEFPEIKDGDTTVFNHEVWGFSRDLTIAGMYNQVGEGDVRFKPYFKMGHVSMRLASPGGSALFLVPRAELKGFLGQTTDLVSQFEVDQRQQPELARAAAELEALANSPRS